ncbi:MAG: nitrate/sulfonate/taurine/bicarbonate superfamily binding cassette transporter, rane protein [Hyphomicrobiales bacterium]|nr:nitrate/sulfonate/taurine/bicarbonate superfamily binding cassette transporter, rane protein [Hyphomicrobiales bacterium]
MSMNFAAAGSAAPTSADTAAPARSPGYRAYLASLRRDTWIVQGWQLGLVALFFALWEIGPRMGWINPMLTSYPSAIAGTLMKMTSDGSLVLHTWVTLKEILVGFAGGMALGTLLAVALWWSPMVYRIADPFIVVLNALPKIALVPIFYIWLGDMASIYAMAIAVSLFVTVLMLFTGFQAIDPDKVRLVRLFGASQVQVLTKIVLPGSVPTMISTLKVNVGLALVGVIVGEFQAAKAGLGYLITYGSQIFQMNLVMTSIFVLAVISTLLFALIQSVEATVLRRYGSGPSGT